MGVLPDQELLVNLRKELHKFPEMSGSEEMTSLRITGFLKELGPDELISHLGGYGVAARFRGKTPGPRVMIRSELDALPIDEPDGFEHRSASPGVSHKCGHDGHMAIAAGVALLFSKQRHERGELVVLFQPSEENGKGACEVLNDPAFSSLTPDYILAMHNLPGFPRHEIILREGVFAAASEGMIINLRGKTAHAGEPHNGISPSPAVSQILQELPDIALSRDFHDFTLATIIHARIGEVAFGTSPGDAVVMATLRAYDRGDMEKLRTRATGLVEKIALREKLGVSVGWTERFPATVNDRFLTSLAGEVANRTGYKVRHIEKPFRWSEDFGWFTRRHPGLLFGIGAGLGHPELHNPDYDFPDEIISTGVGMIGSICRELLK
jgi:amidohydrolase